MSQPKLPITNQTIKYAPLFMGVLISLCFALYALVTPLSERVVDWKFYDFYNSYSASIAPAQNIIIIDIDDQSIETLGQWPWPRYRLAQAIRLITEDRPSALLVDILLSEKDRSSLINIQESFASEFAVQLNFPGIPQVLTDNDAYFAEVIDKTPTILASMLTQHNVSKEALCTDNNLIKVNQNVEVGQLKQYNDIICPLHRFSRNSASTGFINATIDKDGLLRRIPIVMQYNDKLLPSLPLAGLMVMLGSDAKIENDKIGNFVNLNGRKIPIDSEGNALINFRGEGRHYETISILSLLSGEIPADYFLGKIVLLGATASALNDIVSTHLDVTFPGIEAHATLIDNVLNNDLLKTANWFNQLEGFIILLLGLSITILIMSQSVSVYSLSSLFIVSIILIVPAILLQNLQLYVSPFLVLINLISVFIVVTALKYYSAEKHLLAVLKSISNASLSIIDSMATVAELRDSETGGHIIRTRLYVKAMSVHLQTKDKYKQEITDDYISYIFAAVPLHDIGKVGIPDNILLKPGKLTPDELVIMRTHVALGGDILKQTEEKVGASPYLDIAIEIANCHHERWDGSGYPMGLHAEDIPLSARIMAIADVFDALVNRRVYKEAMSFDETIKIIKQGAGNHFDPNIVDAFLEIKEEMITIAQTVED
ncbi:CHASE2 domain-containing protein [Psychromonas sp. KJ10-10]|uniref:CHASE2 domain-containing protein n=1 Tax=Psychromonas sp. KJ10-10 TaxID=3391823 RepID=UPI0039B5E1F4